MYKLKSLCIFFPFFNDAGTVKKAVEDAYKYGKKITSDLEVVTIHGGRSSDNTQEKILEVKKKHPNLVIVDKRANKEGYAVIKYGFKKAKKDWIFYTDGDLQYSLEDLDKLVEEQNKTDADVVNGFKKNRQDSILRVIFGNSYRYFSRVLFKLPISDLTCDFRLIKASFLRKLVLESHDSSLLLELIKKLQKSGAKFAEVGVKHYPRTYGKSAYSVGSLFRERLFGDIRVMLRLYADSDKGNSKR